MSSSSFTRAPRRPHFEYSFSPPRLRSFEELDQFLPKDSEAEQARVLQAKREQEVKKQVREMHAEDWLLRGGLGFLGRCLHL